MEPPRDQVRLKLVIGKFRVVKRDRNWFVLDMLNGIKMTVHFPASADVREGDMLTMYTEVLCAEPITTSVQ